MRILILLLMPFICYANHRVELHKFCNSNIDIIINSNYKLKQRYLPEFITTDCGFKAKSICAVGLFNKMNLKQGFTIQLYDSTRQSIIIIDSCIKKLLVDNCNTTICRYNISNHFFLVARIKCKNDLVEIIFDESDLHFVEEILQSTKIIED